MKKTFEKKLKKGTFISCLDKKYFDRKYIDKLRKDFLNGKKTSGQELVDLFALSLHELVYEKNLKKKAEFFFYKLFYFFSQIIFQNNNKFDLND